MSEEHNDDHFYANTSGADMTEQLRTANALRRSRDFLRLLSHVRDAIAHELDDSTLFKRICDLLIQYADCQVAWVVRPDDEGWFQILAVSGEVEYLDGIRISNRVDLPEGNGPIGRVWRTQQPIFDHAIAEDMTMEPWRSRIDHFGMKHVTILPLQRHDQIWAVLVITHRDDTHFDEELQQLLTELANSLSFGLTRLDLSRKNQELFSINSTLINGTTAGISVARYPERVLEQVNQRMADMFGAKSTAELIAMEILDFYPDQTTFYRVSALANKVLRQGTGILRDTPFIRLDGSFIWIDLTGNRMPSSHTSRVIWTYVDVTERHRFEQALRRSQEFYALLSRANEVIAQATCEKDLLQQICELAIKHTNLGMAWIGSPDENGWFQFHAAAGEIGYLDGIRISNRGDVSEGQGSVGRSWRTRQPIFYNSIEHIHAMSPWRERIIRFNLRSSATLPLYRKGQIWGILSVYHLEDGVFDDDLQGILIDLANDIGFGLNRLDLASQERQASQLNDILLNNLNAGVSVIRYPDRIIETINPKMIEIFGATSESDMIGRSVREAYSDVSTHLRIGEFAQTVLRIGSGSLCDIPYRRVDGTVIYIDLSGQKYDRGDGMERIIWTHVDVTNRHQNETRILELNRQKSLLLNNTIAGINVVRYPERMIIEANQRFAELMGYKHPEEIIGLPTIQIYPNEYEYQRMDELSHLIMSQGQGFLSDLIVRNPCGTQRYLDVEGKLLDSDDDHRSILWTTIDVTDRHYHLENWMKEARIRLNLINNMAIGIFLINHRIIHRVSRRILDLFGYEEEEIIGQSTRFLFHTEEQFRMFETFYQQLEASPTGMVTMQYHFQKKDGNPLIADVTGAWLDPDHPSQGIIGTLQDITEKLDMEAMIRANQIRIQSEMEVAAALQQAFLPHHLPNFKSVNVVWKYIPCDFLAGDMLNVISLDDHHLGFYVLDVMGHGVSAALNAFAINYYLHPIENGKDRAVALRPGDLLTVINERFSDFQITESYFTLFYGVLDLSTLVLKYAKGGHPSPLLVHENGDIEALQDGNMPLGIIKGTSFATYTQQLTPGDKLLVYSDGLTEVFNDQGEVFSTHRVIAAMTQHHGREVHDFVDHLIEAIVSFAGKTQWSDDATLIALEMR